MLLPAFLAFGLALAPAAAQEPLAPPAEGGGPSQSSQPPRPMRYDASAERTLQGTVEAVEARSMGRGRMVTLAFQADGAAWKVLVGPEEILTRQNLSFAAGDVLSILGAAMAGPDGQVFLARQITRGDRVLTLLDASGQPVRR